MLKLITFVALVAFVAFVALVSIAIGISKVYTSITLQIVQERVSHALTRRNYLPGLHLHFV